MALTAGSVTLKSAFKILFASLLIILALLASNTVIGASGSTPLLREITAICPSPCCLDIAFVLDASGSMGDTVNGLTKLDYLKEAMYIFINRTCPDEGFAVGIVVFYDHAENKTLDGIGLGALWLVNGDNVKKSLNDTISGLVASGFTNMGDGISNGTAMILHGIYNIDSGALTPNRPDCGDIIILVSDGLPNRPLYVADPEEYAREKADEARALGIRIVGIYVGDPATEGDEFLESISDYFINTTIENLPSEFDKLYSELCVIATPTPSPSAVGGEVIKPRPGQGFGGEQMIPVMLGIFVIAAGFTIFLGRKRQA